MKLTFFYAFTRTYEKDNAKDSYAETEEISLFK